MNSRIAPLLLLPGLAFSGPALAQVQVNPGALDHLSPAAPSAPAAPEPHRAAPVHKPPARVVRRAAPAHTETPVPASTRPGAKPPRPVPPHPPSSALAPAAPAPASLTPLPPPLTPSKPLPTPVIPVVPDAADDVRGIQEGVRITFPAGKSDLSPVAVTALRDFARAVLKEPDQGINVYGYASGTPDDPSTPRRLSLSRALAARTVLLTEQIPSTRIYVRALGTTVSDGPQERVDVQLARAAAHPTPPATPPAPSPAPRTP